MQCYGMYFVYYYLMCEYMKFCLAIFLFYQSHWVYLVGGEQPQDMW